MDPITLVMGALKLADATGLSGWIGSKVGGTVGAEAAKQITGIATQLTGAKSPEEALEMVLADQELAGKLRQKIIDNEQELDLAHLRDVDSARKMYENTDHTLADDIARDIYKWNKVYIVLLIILNSAAVLLFPASPAISIISNLVGVSIGYLWNERAQVSNFLFGSSRGSKQKSQEMRDSIKKAL